VGLSDDLEQIAEAAAAFADPEERVAGMLAAEPATGMRVYLCAYAAGAEERRSWLALDAAGRPLTERARVREAVSIAALVELAGDTAGGGDLEELRQQLVTLRLTENPPGIDEAESAALALEHVLGVPPRVATPALLDEIAAAARRLESALGEDSASPFAEAMRHSVSTIDALTTEVEATYKLPLG
jgi:hypothetical protein